MKKRNTKIVPAIMALSLIAASAPVQPVSAEETGREEVSAEAVDVPASGVEVIQPEMDVTTAAENNAAVSDAVTGSSGDADSVSAQDGAEPKDSLTVDSVSDSAEVTVPEYSTAYELPAAEEVQDADANSIQSVEETEDSIVIEEIDGQRYVTVQTQESYSSMRYAIWSDENRQDDLKWYALNPVTMDGQEYWTGALNLSELLHAGDVHVHIYADKSDFLGKEVISISEEEISANLLSVSESGTSRNVTVKVSGASKVRAAIWSRSGGQDDLKWYSLTKASGNTWTGMINTKNLQHSGETLVHVYVDGKMYTAGEFLTTSEEVNERYFEISETSGSATKTITAHMETSVSSMKAAVWSSEGGQDDLKWYTLKKSSGNN